MAKKYKSRALGVIHKSMKDFERCGTVDKKTMREFDVMCLTPIEPMPPEKIAAIREREEVSQVVFAFYLNVTASLVSKWERGEKKPQGASLKLLNLVDKKGLDLVA